METTLRTTPKFTNAIPFLFPLIFTCFFISGFTGLVYEILWTRMIVKIIGSAPFSVSIVLTVFMGGLGLGSYLAGKKIDQIKNPLSLVQIYGGLELVIAIYGLIFPLLLVISKPIFSTLYNQLFPYFWLYNLITFLGISILLIIPVTCMGATLPVLSRFFITNIDRTGTNLGRLYGLNTIGAAFGSLVCGFWLINYLGVWGALGCAIFLNSMIGVVCLLIARKQIPEANDNEADAVAEAHAVSPSLKSDTAMNNDKANQEVSFALFIFAISGFSAMAYEVIWIKLLGIIIGPTTYSFTIVLVTFITCLALGSLFFGRLADKV
jgi:spermidine synthase